MGVPRLPALVYGKYVVISRPRYDENLGAWVPYASVCWDGDGVHYHQLQHLDKTFTTEEQALAYGFAVAHNWIAKERWKSCHYIWAHGVARVGLRAGAAASFTIGLASVARLEVRPSQLEERLTVISSFHELNRRFPFWKLLLSTWTVKKETQGVATRSLSHSLQRRVEDAENAQPVVAGNVFVFRFSLNARKMIGLSWSRLRNSPRLPFFEGLSSKLVRDLSNENLFTSLLSPVTEIPKT
jgi:hypothetical protein